MPSRHVRCTLVAVGDCGQMIVVEAMPKPEQSAGEQSEFERGRHPLVGYEVKESGATVLFFSKPLLGDVIFVDRILIG